ncbi:MAG: hypothetical protein CM15mP120_11300 [Pseudomonadota bacterium]|nr:MAG: hypothetical protein CM15mP120_11300 [Pseudomonadota bacterium]
MGCPRVEGFFSGAAFWPPLARRGHPTGGLAPADGNGSLGPKGGWFGRADACIVGDPTLSFLQTIPNLPLGKD